MRVVIADDHAVSRRGLGLLIADHFGAVDIAEAESLDAAIALLTADAAAELVVLDLRMPGMSGAEGIAALREAFPLTRVVVLSGSDAREDVLAALGAGAHAFIRKAESETALLQALKLVLAGGVYVPPDFARLSGQLQPSDAETAAPASLQAGAFDVGRLSPRQREVFEHLALGRATKEIARLLNLAEGTVKVHTAAVQRALGARSRAEAVALSARYRSLRPQTDD